MKYLLILLILVLTFNANAQSKKDRTKEFGIDIFETYSAFLNKSGWVELDLFYKKHKKAGDFRIRLNTALNFNPGDVILEEDACHFPFIIFEDPYPKYKAPMRPQLSIGYAFKKSVFYYGGDVNLGVLWGRTYQRGCGEELMESFHPIVGITPFGGVRLPITKRLNFTVELGVELNYVRHRVPYLTTSNTIERIDVSGFRHNLKRNYGINDIAISFLF